MSKDPTIRNQGRGFHCFVCQNKPFQLLLRRFSGNDASILGGEPISHDPLPFLAFCSLQFAMGEKQIKWCLPTTTSCIHLGEKSNQPKPKRKNQNKSSGNKWLTLKCRSRRRSFHRWESFFSVELACLSGVVNFMIFIFSWIELIFFFFFREKYNLYNESILNS